MFLLASLLLVGFGGTPRDAAASPPAVVVGYHAQGPASLDDCAEALWTTGKPFADATHDASPSLDRWHEKYGAERVEAVFRRADGSRLEDQVERLESKLSGIRRRRARAIDSKTTASKLAHVYRVEIADPGRLRAAVAELRDDPHVAFAQFDHLYALDFEPNDPYLSSAGSWGQSFSDLWGLDRIGTREAWQSTRGAGQLVAVVDTGVDYLHPDIASNIWVNPGEDLDSNGIVDASDVNGIDDDGNGFVDDLRGFDFAGSSGEGDEREDETIRRGDPDPFDELGHGTHVAGTIAAVADNGIGIAGVAPEARIMALKGFDAEGHGRDSDLWRAVLYAIENGATVINASWSCHPACPDNPLAESILGLAEATGTVFVTSAGNRSADVVLNSPERTSLAITVGSLGFDDALSSFSNRGWLLDLLAPGGGPNDSVPFVARRNILSLAASSLGPLESAFIVGDDYYRLAGTSMAAPHVAGAVALLRSLRPDLMPRDIRRLLRTTSRDLGADGHDPLTGAGVLDLPRLLETPLPDLDLAIIEPRPGAIVDPEDGPVSIRVQATGPDLASVSIAQSRGVETNEFEEIASAESFEAIAPVDWGTHELPDGPRVLRVRAELRDGRLIDEFSIVSLERTRPIRVSQSQVDEHTPSIDERRVVWQALPDGLPASGEIRVGGFVSDRTVKKPFILKATDLTQRLPVVSDNRVVWLESDGTGEGDDLRGCDLGQRTKDGCIDGSLIQSDTNLSPIRMALGRIVWRPLDGIEFQIEGCRWRRGARACEAKEIEADPGSAGRRMMDFDGRTLLFFRNEGTRNLEICSPALGHEPCEARSVLIGDAPISADRAALDGGLLAFEFIRSDRSVLGHCNLDVRSGRCDNPRFIDGVVDGRDPDVSGRRIVWTEYIEGEPSSVHACEVDAVTGNCPRRRLAGAHAPASAPRIDGDRVVWQDGRFGPTQILGLDLTRCSRDSSALECPLR